MPLVVGAFCETATVLPATVTVPERAKLALDWTDTFALLEPVLPAVTVIQDVPEAVVHVHPV